MTENLCGFRDAHNKTTFFMSNTKNSHFKFMNWTWKKSYVRFNVKICLHSKWSVVEVTSQLCLSIEPKIIPYVGSLTFGSLTSHFWTPSYTDHFDDHITPHTFKRRNGEILEYGYLAKSLATLNYFSKAHRQMAWKCLRWETESEEWLQGVQA